MIENTSSTMLDRLRDGENSTAWEEFHNSYWRAMFVFAKRQGASHETAADVIQDSLLAVYQNRRTFRYDPTRGKFRNWLFTIVCQKLALHHRKKKLPSVQLPEEQQEEAVEKTDVVDVWNAIFDKSLLVSLLECVRKEVSPETYQAFEMTTLHGLSGKDAAKITGLSRNAVFLARRRIKKRLVALGSSYKENQQLSKRLAELEEFYPPACVETAIRTQVENTMAHSL